ncbi:RHS repeat protein [Mucilaginibacter lappiensis]|uniref:YD repeat-containing protein n=1 Tax=Mucilaginibacter lappiensis TaxID=354630 RepID=A0A841JIS7_9SPHI|nr:RHS repeat domain-containing protein [Mucilaginibacter lappiensis]MBB6128335.1 YD repeat-containing protein [Mucilaginibacter lappiensis]
MFGQATLPNVTPPSPEASSLGKFVDMPVGLYNGIPQISIPIFEIPINGKAIPISLSYHASGIKVTEIPSSVGLGWALNAGGVITRTVRGAVDEIDGYMYSPAIPQDPNCLTGDAMQQYMLIGNPSSGHGDTEPDLFYFNFNGISGKFVIDKNKVVHQIPYTNMKITPISNGLGGWKIITEDGIEYSFTTIETTSIAGAVSSNSYYLTNIKYPDSDQGIAFSYTASPTNYNLPLGETLYERSTTQQSGGCEGDLFVGGIQLSSAALAVTSQQVSKITFPNGQVEFLPGNYRKDYTGGRVLDKIRISNNNGIIKSFKLNYNYFTAQSIFLEDDGTATASTAANTSLRLSLKNIQEFAADNITTKPPYVFQYYTATVLPDRFSSKSQDHWGYYNGQSNATLLPTHTRLDGTTFTGAIRTPSESYAKAGTLSQITYPTGGTTNFDFELNQASSGYFPDATASGFTGNYIVGNCHTAGAMQFVIADDYNSTVPVTLQLRTYQPNDTYSITRQVCSGNSNGPLPTSVVTYIYFQILNVSDPNNPQIVYNSYNDNWSIGNLAMAVGKTITLPNGTYRIKAIRGNSNMTLSAPEIISSDGNFTSRFIFEAKGSVHQRPLDGLSSPVGGLRVKQITAYDPITQKKVIKLYDYTNNGVSSGTANWAPVYQFPFSRQFSNCEGGVASHDYIVYHSGSNLPLSEMLGYVVGYGKVTVTEVDEQNQTITNGKAEYFFTNPKDFSFTPVSIDTYFGTSTVCFSNRSTTALNQFPFGPTLSPDWAKGLLTDQINYKRNDDGSYVMIKRVTNKYKSDYLGQIYDYNPQYDVVAMSMGIITQRDTRPNEIGIPNKSVFRAQFYYIPSRYSKLIETDETIYSGSDSTKATKTFTYDNLANLQPTSSTLTDSKKDVYKSLYKYPTDFASVPVYAAMIGKNMISPVIQTDNYKYDTFLNQTKTNYDVWGNVIAPASVQSVKLANAADVRVQFFNYNTNGGVLDLSKAKGPHIGYHWGYNNQYPVSTCQNSTEAEYYFEGFEESTASGVTVGIGHTGKKYTTSAAVSWTKPNNTRAYVISYWYRSGGVWRYQAEQAYTGSSFTMIGGDAYDDVRIYPNDAQMTTYTYEPLVGETSMTDAKGETTTYEYDAFQRLINVKDKDGNILKHMDYHYQGQ